MKKILALTLFGLIILSLTGCGAEKGPSQGDRFTDDLGREVVVADTERTACLLGSFADMWMLAGGDVVAAADDAWEDFALPLGARVVNLGSTHRPNLEELLLCKPTLVLASAKLTKHLDIRSTLEELGIAVAYFDVACFEDYLRVLKLMTRLTGNDENYKRYGSDQQERINKVINNSKASAPQRVLVMRASAASIRAKASDDTMLGGMLKDLGCINVADDDGAILDNLSVEGILLKDPEKIFFVETGDDSNGVKAAVENMFAENPLWGQLTAVKKNKVYFMDKRLYNLKPNARFAEAYERLEKILYER